MQDLGLKERRNNMSISIGILVGVIVVAFYFIMREDEHFED